MRPRAPYHLGVMSVRRLTAVVVAAVLLGAQPGGPAAATAMPQPPRLLAGPPSGPLARSGLSARADPLAVAPRYAGRGWADTVQAGAAVLACSAGCTTTGWVDVDADPSTVDSSQAVVSLPPGAGIDWAGLYWAGDRGSGPGGHCATAAPDAAPATPPPAPDRASDVLVAVAGQPYQAVPALSLADVAGGSGFQAVADITSLLRRYGGRSSTATIPLTVGGLQVAAGAGCTGGWTVYCVYSFRDGPQPTYAPDYRSIAVFDTVQPIRAGETSQVALSWPATAGADRVAVATMGGARLALDGLPLATGSPAGPGYRMATQPLPAGALAAGSTRTLAATATTDGWAATIVAVSAVLAVRAKLALTARFTPAHVAVGSVIQLTLALSNDGDLPDSGVAVTAPLPAGLTVAEPESPYNAATGVWTVGTVAPHAAVTLTLDIRVEQAGTFGTQARVSASAVATDVAPTQLATVIAETVVAPSAGQPGLTAAAAAPDSFPTTLPTLTPGMLFGIGIFALGLLMMLIVVLRYRADRR